MPVTVLLVDDLDVGLRLQHGPQTRAYEGFVIDQENGDRHPASLVPRQATFA